LLTEGATEKVLHFIMVVASVVELL
jgi:hypothetical protein